MPITEGSVALGRLAKRHTRVTLSQMLNVSDGSIRNWIKGRTLPTPEAQSTMEQHPEVSIPGRAWTSPPSPTPEPKVTKRKKQPRSRAVPPESPVATREEASRTVATLSRQVREADEDEHASWSHKASLANALTSALRTLGKLDGSGELSESQVVRSRPFQQAMRLIEGALGSHPAAALAVAQALEGFGEDTTTT